MGMAITLEQYLNQSGVSYDLITHPYTSSSMKTAQAAHVPGQQVAKSILLEDDLGYMMAVIPATHRLDLGTLRRQLGRRLGLATENELGSLFQDCTVGAVPPLGEAYGLETIVDESLSSCHDIYFEAGSHTDLVHVTGGTFQNLLKNAKHGSISHHI